MKKTLYLLIISVSWKWWFLFIFIFIFINLFFIGILLNLNHKKYPKIYRHIYCLWAYRFFILDITTLPFLIIWTIYFVLFKIVVNQFWVITIKRFILLDLIYYLLIEFPFMVINFYWVNIWYSYYNFFALIKRLILYKNFNKEKFNILNLILFWIILPIGYYYYGIWILSLLILVFFFEKIKKFIELFCFTWKHEMRAYSKKWDTMLLEQRVFRILMIFRLTYNQLFLYELSEQLQAIQHIRENNSIIYKYIKKMGFTYGFHGEDVKQKNVVTRIWCPGYKFKRFFFPNKTCYFFNHWSSISIFEQKHFDCSEKEKNLFWVERKKAEEIGSWLEWEAFIENRKQEKLKNKLKELIKKRDGIILLLQLVTFINKHLTISYKIKIINLDYEIQYCKRLLNSKRWIRIEWLNWLEY